MVAFFVLLFFQLSDCVVFSTFVGLLPVRMFPFFSFLYAPHGAGFSSRGCLNQAAPPLSLISSVWFCLAALSPIFHSENSTHDASVFSSLLAADHCLPSHSPVFVCCC